MLRYVFLFVIIISACRSNDHEDLWQNIDLCLSQKNTVNLENAVRKQLTVYDSKDSIAGYINLCSRITDSLTAWKQYNEAAKYAVLASSKENRVQGDSTLKNRLAAIDYNAAHNIFDFRYNDTCLGLFETAIRNTGSVAIKSNISQGLGIMYNILGDRNKTALYYHLCYQGRLQLQQNREAGTLEKTNKSLAGAIINKLIFFNDYNQYDSTITYANIGLQLDSLEPKKTAYLKAFLAEALFYTGSRKAALPLTEESLQLLSRENQQDEDTQNRVRDVLGVKASLLAGENEYGRSNECLFAAYRIMQDRFTNRYTGKVLIAIAANFLQMGNTDSAVLYAHKALSTVVKIDSSSLFSLPAMNDLYAENTIEESAGALAAAFTQKYRETNDIHFTNAAIECYDIAFAVENKLLSYYEYDESKLAVLEESRSRSEKAITLCYQLLQKTNNTHWAEKAFAFAEGNKSIVLLQSLKKNIAANKLLQHDTSYQQLQTLRLQAAFTEKIIVQNAAGNMGALHAAEQKAASINADIIRVSALLTQNNRGYKESILKNDSLDLLAIRQKLLKNDSTAILEFFNGEHSMYAFVFAKNKPVQVISYDSSLPASIHQYLSFFTREDSIASNPRGYEDAAFDLYQQLGLPAFIQQYPRIIIIPDGIFSFIPFESLLYKSVSSLSLKTLPYLINICNSSYGFSAATLLKQTEQKNNSGKDMLAMAPLFIRNSRGFAPLPGTAKELATIQPAISEGNYFSGAEATLNAFRQHSSNAAYIHLATHAFADNNGAEPEIEFADSSLSLGEIYAMPLHANLAVLSACNTGIGTMQKGEGFMSLARGFYYAGVPHIITSLWQVNDEATAGLFKNFYTSLEKEGYENAFHQSRLQYLQSQQAGEKYSPYYWAGLIFMGNDDVPASSHTIPYSIAAILVAAIVYLMIRRRK